MTCCWCVASVSLVFGMVVVVAGLVGTVAGSFTATRLRQFTTDADPLVCAFSMLVAAPLQFTVILCSGSSVFWVSCR